MKKKVYILIFLSSWAYCLIAQCPQFYNGLGVASSNPYWIGCSGGNFTIFVQPTISITGGYDINWGDGTANSTGANLIPPAFISHTYTAAVDTFPVTITTTFPACTISGVVVMEITPSASIQIPLGNPIYGCTPASFNFQNASTNVSETTRFTWTFGDGSPAQIYNATNLGQVLSHTYLPGTTNCNVAVTLMAENYCNSGNPSTNVYQPIQVWDRDNVNITPDALIKCFPSTTFHFDNTTTLNCFALGNTQQRYEYWNFGDYWGLGYDSIINWQPFNPPNRPGYDITYPGIGTYNILLKDSSFCGLDTAVIAVQIVAPPIANLSLNTDSICEGESITATNLSTGGGNQFIWNFGDGSGNSTVSTTAAQTHTYSTAGTYTVSLIANISGTSGCTTSDSIQITIKPTPTADFNLGSNNYCDTGIETFINTSSGAISTYSWNFGNGNISTLQNPLPESYTGAGTYNVLLSVTGMNGCIANKTRQVNVFQSPNAQINPFSACKAASGMFTDASTSAIGDPLTSWLWNFGDFSATSSAQNPSHTFADSGFYNVTLTVTTAFCSNKDSITVTVNPLPVSNYLQSANAGCTALAVSFTNQSTGASSYTWNFGDGTTISTDANPNHTFSNPQTYDTTYFVSLIVISSFGCQDTFSTAITVFHAATASFTSDYLISCSPLPVQFTNTSTGATGYSWDFGDGSALSTAASPNHIFVNNTSFLQTYTTILTVNSSNGCTNSTVQNITLYPNPDFSITALPTDTGCSPLSISFNAASGGAVYQWDFGDGSTSLIQSPNHIFINNGITDTVYQVILITTTPFSCKDTADLNINVHPNPIANFTQSSSLGCSPLIVSFSDNSVMANTHLWDFGDGNFSTVANPIHTFVNNTSATKIYYVTLQVTTISGCIDTMIRAVEIFPKVTAEFTCPAIGCNPYSANFTNQSINAVTYLWDFGNGSFSGQNNPSNTYINSTTNDQVYTIQLIAFSNSGCADTVNKTITVAVQPIAGFSPSPLSQTYPSAEVNVINTSNAGVWNYSWNWGDSNSSSLQNPLSNSYSTWGTYTITLIVNSTNCADTVSHSITIIPPLPVAGFNIPSYQGCEPEKICFVNSSQYTVSSTWEFGDGNSSNSQNPCYTYNSAGIFNVKLIATGPGGQTDVADAIVNIYPKPQANFSATPTLVQIPNTQAQFLNLSIDADTYSWNFGDGGTSTEENPKYAYTQVGQYDIILIATNQYGCTDSIIKAKYITAEQVNDIVLPNAFTPNSTASNGGAYDPASYTNDVFFPFTINGIDEYRLTIFNKWGEIIFETFDLKIGWDGNYRGALCQSDVYIWKIEGKYLDGTSYMKCGDVTLLR